MEWNENRGKRSWSSFLYCFVESKLRKWKCLRARFKSLMFSLKYDTVMNALNQLRRMGWWWLIVTRNNYCLIRMRTCKRLCKGIANRNARLSRYLVTKTCFPYSLAVDVEADAHGPGSIQLLGILVFFLSLPLYCFIFVLVGVRQPFCVWSESSIRSLLCVYRAI